MTDGEDGARTSRPGEAGERRTSRPRRSAVREYAEAIGIALVIALLLRSFLVEAFKIPSGSMVPTLEIGDRIFVNKASYRTEVPWSLLGVHLPFGGRTLKTWALPERGDVVVFRHPDEPDVDYIKRVIGLPGDRVQLRDNDLLVNGERLPRARPRTYRHLDQSCREVVGDVFDESVDGRAHTVMLGAGPDLFSSFGPVTVSPDHVFVLGDSRDNSRDSRVWGELPVALIKGRAMVTWLSLDPCGGLRHPVRWSRMFRGLR